MTDLNKLPASGLGENPARLWGLSNHERTRRIAREAKHDWREDLTGANGGMIVNEAFAFDPLWYRHIASQPGMVLTMNGAPVIAHCRDAAELEGVASAIRGANVAPPSTMQLVRIEDNPTVENKQLRKRVTPFVAPLTAASASSIERETYYAAYKGVTDVLTKYLWPELALWGTRLAARIGMTPNQVTSIGFLLCILAGVLFWHGHFWWGMLSGFIFMVLDTVDGKLARCTITSSKWGNVFDHGIDIVHPPFWWWAWGVGLSAWGLALPDAIFIAVMAVIVLGYVVQRVIEGVFMRRNGMMHIHVWEPVDSQFRLITARRNPNMVILFVATLLGRPDIGLIAVAAWTAISCLFHAVRLAQAELRRARGSTIRSWMEQAG